jgi:5-methylthioadenosine/S-adenosylhomocysteine deaminase
MAGITRKTFIKGAAGSVAMGLNPALPAAAADEPDNPAAQGKDFILGDAMVLTMDGKRRAFESGFVWIRSGRIHRVGATSELGPVPEGVAYRSVAGHIIMPGLINCHTHLSNGVARGIFDEMPLEVWFSKGMWSVLNVLDGPTGEAGAALSLVELMNMGVTTTAVGEFGTPNNDLPDGVLKAIHRSGIRAVLSRMTVDSPDDSSPAQFIPARYREKPAHAADEVRRLQRTYNSELISVCPEALGVMRCTPEMVVAMHDVAVETGSHFVMHAAASQDARDESRRRFGHGSITELGKLGVLGPKTLLAHGIWLDDREIDELVEHQTGVSHNPVSNAYYAAGVARLPAMLKAGIRTGLGVDGASTNNSQNVWETMKMAVLVQKQWNEDANFGSAELALELMTRGGAHALHMEDEIGSLEVGKRADLIVIDTERVALAPAQTVISNLVYSNDPAAVRDVYVDGQLVVRDGTHQRFEKESVIDGARVALGRLLKRTGLDSYIAERGGWQWHRQ